MATLSLCMIARDEQEWIDELLKSVRPHVDEIIVALDHRTTDDTRDILNNHNAKIVDFQWIDDFSAARNSSLGAASSDWILVLDADERLSKKDLIKIKKLIKNDDTDAYFLLQRNYTTNQNLHGWKPNDKSSKEAKGTGYTDNPLIRLFRNDKRIRFSNPVHEIVDVSLKKMEASIIKTNIPIHHYGHLKKEEDLVAKRDMYLKISRRQISQDPSNPRPYYEAGKVLKAQGHHKEAKTFLEKCAALNPSYQLVLTNLADVYHKLGETKQAIHTYLRAIKARPKNENGYINLALLFSSEGKTKEAIILLDRAISLNPKSSTAYNNLALLLLKSKRPIKALTVLRRGLDKTGLDKFKYAIEKLKPKVERLLSKKEIELKTQSKKDPSDLSLITKLGQVYFAQQKFDEAIKLFKKTLDFLSDKAMTDEKKIPYVFNMYSNLSMAYQRAGKKKKAIEVINKALSLNPPHKEFFEKRIKELEK